MGEHAVVYGKPALLAAINLRLTVSVEASEKFKIVSREPADYVRYAAEFLAKEYNLQDLPKVKITITSDIPAGFHLGSSAAVAVSVVAAGTYFLKKLWNPTQINTIAYEIEKKQHGNPSGGDNTAVTMGGFIWFRKELEFLKSMWQLPFNISNAMSHFFLINTGRPRETTGEMVEHVHSQFVIHKSQFNKLFDRNEEQTKKIAVALKEEKEKDLIDAIRVGERTLEEMGVVSKKVIPVIRNTEHLGGAAKILGGGGRKDGVGFLLGYHRSESVLHELCATYNFPIQKIQLGCVGVTLERKK